MSNNGASPDHAGPDVHAAKAYALERLARELRPTLYYHSLWHTQDEVAPRAIWLAEREGLSRAAQGLVATAAYFHDLGFTVTRKDHEQVSAQIACEVLPGFGYTPEQIALIQGMILATRIPQTPHTLLEQIIADADLDVLGRSDFVARNQALRLEMAAEGVTQTDMVWYAHQLIFFDQHHYFTPTARHDRLPGKMQNRMVLQRIMRDCCPQEVTPPKAKFRLHSLAMPGALTASSPTSPLRHISLVQSPTLR
jgi:uncharacterized protein